VEYESLAHILHPRDAIRPDAPLIHQNLEKYQHDHQIRPIPGTNISHHYRLHRGDVDAVFIADHVVIENEYWVPWIAHVQLEPQCSWALWGGDGLTVWSSSQAPFFIRETLADLFGISPAKVRVVVPYVGGGFGGKSDVTIEPLLAIAARAVPGIPVQLLLTREEMFFGSVVGRGAWGRVKTAVDRTDHSWRMSRFYFGSGVTQIIRFDLTEGHNSTGPYILAI
jgi:carbon-monoxide dehydrogenase large subunit